MPSWWADVGDVVGDVVGGAPLGLAAAAGMLAAVNPCGFALLPAYLSLLIIGVDTPSRGRSIMRALAATAAMTAGFAAVFGAFGLLITPIAGQVQRHLPPITIGIGLLLAGLGIWLLAGRSLPGLPSPGTGGKPVTRTATSMAGFGAAYAIASLSCTIGPFLAIVVTSFRAGSIIQGVALFFAYAAGMGITVAAAAVAVALARDSLIVKLRRAGPMLSRLGGLLLLTAGGYVAYYGWWETRTRTGNTTTDPVIDVAGTVQRWLSGLLDHAGLAVLALSLAVLLAIGLATALITRRRDRAPHGHAPADRVWQIAAHRFDRVVTEASRLLPVAPHRFWPLLTDHQRYGRLAPNLSKVEVINQPGQTLRRRCTSTTGQHWEETSRYAAACSSSPCAYWLHGQYTASSTAGNATRPGFALHDASRVRPG